MKWPDVARLNPWAGRRKKRLDGYLETEQHGFTDAIKRHRKERDEKERLIDLELFQEGRAGSNRLENREMRVSAMVCDYQRILIDAQIDIRKKLGIECPELLSDAQLAKLQIAMLRLVQPGRQVRQDDYKRRA